MPSYRPSPEQYAAMIEAATAAGQPLPRTHVSLHHKSYSQDLLMFSYSNSSTGNPKLHKCLEQVQAASTSSAGWMHQTTTTLDPQNRISKFERFHPITLVLTSALFPLRKSRRTLSVIELRRLARKPWRKTSLSNNLPNNTPSGESVVILD